MIRVYIAGPYSAPDVLSVLGNMRRGIKLACDILGLGYAPFVPWLDYHFALEREVPLETFYAYSMAWLDVSDAVLCCLPGWEQSKGVAAEIARAEELGIPVFYSEVALIDWAEQRGTP